MLVITGPGRSGTSMLCEFCRQLGFNPGGEWCEAIDAGLEHPQVAAINDAMFREARTTGDVRVTLDQFRTEMETLDLAVVKDPRFTFHPAILRAWSSVRPDLTVLLTYRNPEQSLASRNRHKKYLFMKHKASPEALKCDLADTLELLMEREIQYSLLLFPSFLTQYDKVYAALTTLGLEFDQDAGRSIWSATVDESMVHFRQPSRGAPQQVARRGFRNPFKRLSPSHPG